MIWDLAFEFIPEGPWWLVVIAVGLWALGLAFRDLKGRSQE